MITACPAASHARMAGSDRQRQSTRTPGDSWIPSRTDRPVPVRHVLRFPGTRSGPLGLSPDGEVHPRRELLLRLQLRTVRRQPAVLVAAAEEGNRVVPEMVLHSRLRDAGRAGLLTGERPNLAARRIAAPGRLRRRSAWGDFSGHHSDLPPRSGGHRQSRQHLFSGGSLGMNLRRRHLLRLFGSDDPVAGRCFSRAVRRLVQPDPPRCCRTADAQTGRNHEGFAQSHRHPIRSDSHVRCMNEWSVGGWLAIFLTQRPASAPLRRCSIFLCIMRPWSPAGSRRNRSCLGCATGGSCLSVVWPLCSVSSS